MSSRTDKQTYIVDDPVEVTWDTLPLDARHTRLGCVISSDKHADPRLTGLSVGFPPARLECKFGRVVAVMRGSFCTIYKVAFSHGRVLSVKEFEMRKLTLLEEMSAADQLPVRRSRRDYATTECPGDR